MRRAWRATWGLLAASTLALAQQPPPLLSVRASRVTASGAGQQALTAEVKAGALRMCAGGGCSPSLDVPVPERFRAGLDEAQLSVVAVAGRREVVRVVVPDARAAQTWVALLAGPLRPGPPLVLFADVADVTGRPEATEPSLVQVIEDDGARQLVVGTRSGELHLCGRPSALSPRVLDGADLALKPARVQRLSMEERKAARALGAVAAKRPALLGRLLHAVGASSGLGGPGAVTDGDPETSWSEARGRDGRGEFVMMRASRDVPLTSVTITVRPPTRTVEHGAAPQRFYLVDDQGAFEVTMPEDAWTHPGASYQVTFPEPRATSCLALALDQAHVSAADKAPAVTVAEVEATSALDGKISLDELVARLGRGGAEAREASAILVRGGVEARQAIARGYTQLDETARLLALSAIDQGECAESAPFYARWLGSKAEEEVRHARTRIERCARGAVPALTEAVRDEAHPSRGASAIELALLAPADALAVLPRLDAGKERKAFRGALTRAAAAPRAREALGAQLDDATLPPRPTLDLLRAAGEVVREPAIRPTAARALARALAGTPGFDERWLSLAPAGQLAAVGDPAALALLAAAVADPSVPLRSSAVLAAGPVEALRAQLLATASDPEPRVREALARALRGQRGEAERRALLGLVGDEWTFVRMATYDALAEAGPDAALDAALLRRLADDRAPAALARAIEAVGRRRLTPAADRLRALAEDKDRTLEVRARSVRALGAVCHRASTDWLTELAHASAKPLAEADVQTLGGAALVALGRLHPADLPARLGPLLVREAPRPAQLAARAALAESDVCP